jgi:hypothetical protein
MSPKRRQLVAAALGVGCFAAARQAASFGLSYCDGEPIRWEGPFMMIRDKCSIPDNTHADWAYYFMGWRWAQIYPLMDHNWTWYACGLWYNNDWNETILVSRSLIDGASGFTNCRPSWCGWGWHSHWEECDVMIANDQQFDNQPDGDWLGQHSQQGRVVFLHEFGHVMGLLHSDGFDVMRQYLAQPLVGGTGQHAEPLADDAAGYRYLYNYWTYQPNVFASPHRLSPSTGLPELANPSMQSYPVCWGQLTPHINFTIGNNGTVDAFVRIRIFLNNATPPDGYEYGWDLYSYGRYIPALSYFTDYITVPTPALPNGTYQIYWQVDADNTLAEYDEQDNVAYSGASLYVHYCP